MSTSHYFRRAVRIIALSIAVFDATYVHAAADAGMRQATATEVGNVKARTNAAFKDRDDFPVEPTAMLKLEKPLYWSAPKAAVCWRSSPSGTKARPMAIAALRRWKAHRSPWS